MRSCGRKIESICQHMLFPDGGTLSHPLSQDTARKEKTNMNKCSALSSSVAKYLTLLHLTNYESLRNTRKKDISPRGWYQEGVMDRFTSKRWLSSAWEIHDSMYSTGESKKNKENFLHK